MVLHVHEQISINMPKMIDKAIEISQTITKQKEYASGVLTGEAVRKKADEFEKHFELISKQKAYANGVLISEALRKKADEFEGHFEEYLPRARIYNDKLIDFSATPMFANAHPTTPFYRSAAPTTTAKKRLQTKKKVDRLNYSQTSAILPLCVPPLARTA
ncbi:unnamed protein product, partial [Mesorhabditis spiculigera]